MPTNDELDRELENEAGFWRDVLFYMNQYKCDKETAKKTMEKIHDDYSKNREFLNR